jgi:protein-L-isoaspartate(D-aspartate) O-methyltransferase
MKTVLSISMIVRDESAHICTALENLRQFADEIVVLDTGSTDDTKRLAAERGAVVRDFAWCDDFAKARNLSLSYCTQDFVMWLDADDRIPLADAVRLRELLQTEPDWDVLHLPYQYARNVRKMPPRIFRNGIGIHWIYPVHEILNIPKKLRVKRDIDDICVYHSWDRAPGVHSERHLRILEKAIQQPEYRNSSYLLWHIAKEYSGLRERAKAIQYFREAIRYAPPNAGFMLARQYHGLARQYLRLGQAAQAAEAFAKAAQVYPHWREPYCGMADALWRLGDPLAAQACVERAQQIPRHRLTLERSELYDEEVFAKQYVEKARRLAGRTGTPARRDDSAGQECPSYRGSLTDMDSKPKAASEADDSCVAWHAQFVDQLARQGYIKSPHLRAAFRAVPRHFFLAHLPPREAYRDVAITTAHRDGAAASSSSRPSFKAVMLERLEVCSGQRVLEIGAGTAYNAALLSHVVGPTGCVVSVDIGPEIVVAACANLQRAGYVADGTGRVRDPTCVADRSGARDTSALTWLRKEGASPIGLVCRDGCLGDADRAPFDRVMVTGGSWDIIPAWREQLVDGGRLVVPLMLFPQVTLCVALEKRQDTLIGRWAFPCKFIALQGLGAPPDGNWAAYDVTVTPQDGRTPGTAATIIDRPNIHLAVRPRVVSGEW